MTREEILSIEGLNEFMNNDFIYKDLDIVINFSEELGIIDSLTNSTYSFWQPIKPISDIETLKQFLNFFDI
jgi:hypothetical protein